MTTCTLDYDLVRRYDFVFFIFYLKEEKKRNIFTKKVEILKLEW